MVYTCDGCLLNFDSPRGLNIHQSKCKSKNNVNVRSYEIDITGDNDNVINSHIEIGDIVNTKEMNIVHKESEVIAYLPSFVQAKNEPKFTPTVPKAKRKIKTLTQPVMK